MSIQENHCWYKYTKDLKTYTKIYEKSFPERIERIIPKVTWLGSKNQIQN